MIRSLVVASGLALGGFALAHPVAAAPMTPVPESMAGQSLVEKAQWRYCTRWHRECRYRYGYSWGYQRCMRRHGC